MNKFSSVILILTLSGCGSDDTDTPTPVQPLPGNQLNLQSITSSDGIFSSNLGGITSLEKIQLLADGQLLLLGETSTKAEYGQYQGFSAFTNSEGKTDAIQKSETGFADACVHPSGEYSVAAFMPSESQYNQIEIQRFSKAHQLLYSAPMAATTLEPEYDINFDHDEWLNDPFEIVDNPHENIDEKYSQHSISWGRFGLISLNCDQEELLTAFNNGGQKLAKYSTDLTFQWEKVLSIYYWGNSERKSKSTKIAHADNGDIYVIDTLTSNAIPAYNDRFNSHLALAENTRHTTNHILFKHLNAQGELIYEELFPSIHSQFLKDIALYNDHLFVGSISALVKSDAYNNTVELDISILNINIGNRTHTQKFYNIENEDWLNGMTLYGDSLYLFGHIGGNQVDSNSWTSHTKAFYARFDIAQNTLEAATTIQHERSSEIKDLVISDNKIIAVGVTSAPLTHSDDISRQGLFVSQ
ncbi:hypothetical protein ACU6U9_23340 [Pseudomonas sp. HK3]